MPANVANHDLKLPPESLEGQDRVPNLLLRSFRVEGPIRDGVGSNGWRRWTASSTTRSLVRASAAWEHGCFDLGRAHHPYGQR